MRSGSDVSRVLRALARFAAVFVLLWVGFYEIQRSFPCLLTGADLIFQTKLSEESTPHLLKQADKTGLLFFGNSKALSGFVPEKFDSAMNAAGQPVESYNLGLPGYGYFVDRLASIFAAGNVPKYILITIPWTPDEHYGNVFHFVRHDSELMNELFPFRFLPRDIVMASSSAMFAHRPLDYYETNRRLVAQMIADRGYFLIYDADRFPEGRLPRDYKEASDEPTRVSERVATTHGREFRELNRLLETYRVTCLMIPTYRRLGQFAQPPPINQRVAAELVAYPRVQLLGPDYILLDNRYFADRTHLNRVGAELYTEYLADLVAPNLH
ncbi:MAG TPA: hypothetical protein VN867_15970 [Candidatus Binataceae bacterium]|nr:hypothetical protein [Candidatus Binataceae bacterium]